MHVSALFRHPIKSHGREAIDAVTLIEGQTMPWDRTWAVTHEATKFDPDQPEWAHCRNFMIGSRTPGLAGIWARLDADKRAVTLSHADIGELTICPDDAADVARFIEWVGPLCPEDRGTPTGIVSAAARGMTDSNFASVSIMNVASHADVQAELGTPLEQERWRGNIWFDGAGAWAEFGWLDRDVRIGEAVLRVSERIRRCAVTNTNPVTGQRDTPTLDTLNDSFGHQDFGVNATVVQGGTVALGDGVELV